MYPLVIMFICLSSALSLAKRPPELKARVLEFNSVMQFYNDKIQKLSGVRSAIEKTINVTCNMNNFTKPNYNCSTNLEPSVGSNGTNCSDDYENGSARVSKCVLAIDRHANELKMFIISIPNIQEKLKTIPEEFTPIRLQLEKTLLEKEAWAIVTKNKLETKADMYFSLIRNFIQNEVNKQYEDIRYRAKVKAICSSYATKMDIHRKFANYYDSIHSSLNYFDRLRYQTARTIWSMELLKGFCVSEDELKSAQKFYDDLSAKVSGTNFKNFKKNVCAKKSKNLLSTEDCLNLPLTPDAMTVLGYLLTTPKASNE